jgi:hypothetical protein
MATRAGGEMSKLSPDLRFATRLLRREPAVEALSRSATKERDPKGPAGLLRRTERPELIAAEIDLKGVSEALNSRQERCDGHQLIIPAR